MNPELKVFNFEVVRRRVVETPGTVSVRAENIEDARVLAKYEPAQWDYESEKPYTDTLELTLMEASDE